MLMFLISKMPIKLGKFIEGGGIIMKDFIRTDKGGLLFYVLSWGAIVVSFLILFVPVLFEAIVNKIDPFVLQMPWTVFMHIVLWLVIAIALAVIYTVQDIRGEL